MTRRLTLLSLAAVAVVVLATAPVSRAACDPDFPEVRQDVETLTTTQLNNFKTAFTKAATPPAGGGLSPLDKFVAEHVQYFNQIHNYADFLPWHREYLLQFEQMLQGLVPGVTLPYWDPAEGTSVIAGTNVAASPVLQPGWFGGNGTFNDSVSWFGPVQGGWFGQALRPAAGLIDDGSRWGQFSSTVHAPIVRGFGGRAVQTPAQVQLALSAVKPGDYVSMQNAIEFNQHGLIHNFIGGDLASSASPDDPLFWMMHAYLDALWAQWQHASSFNYSAYGGTNSDGHTAAKPDVLPGLGATVASVMTTANLCYQYQAPSNSKSFARDALHGADALTTGTGLPTSVSVATSATAIRPGGSAIVTASSQSTAGAGDITFVVDGATVPKCQAVPLSWTGRTWQAACKLTGLMASATPHVVTAMLNADGDYAASQATVSGGILVAANVPDLQFDTPARAYYGDPIGASTLDATSKARGSFTYTAAPVNDSTNTQTVTASTILHAGEYDLVARFAPAGGSPPQTVTVPYVVDPAPLLIRPNNLYMARGQPTPEITYTAAGFVNGDNPSSLAQSPVCERALGRLTLGKHTIWCEGGYSPDYTISYPSTATLTVLSYPCDPGTACASSPAPTKAEQRLLATQAQLVCHPPIPRSQVKFVRGVRGARKHVRKTTWLGRLT